MTFEESICFAKSNYAVTGLYFYPGDVSKWAGEAKSSARGELEIMTLKEL